MKNWDYRAIVLYSIPLAIAFCYSFFAWFIFPRYTLPTEFVALLFIPTELFMILDMPFLVGSNDPPAYLMGISIFLILCGLLQRYYMKKLVELKSTYRYLFVLGVTYIQTGLFVAILLLIHMIELGGRPEM